MNDSIDNEEQLAKLMTELTEELRRGGTPDINEVARQHPALAGELRELWAAAVIAEEMGKSFGSVMSSVDSVRNARPLDPPAGATADDERRTGEFELIEEIGRGGMGVVYRARHRGLDRIVAVKMLLEGMLASSADVKRFLAEAASAARLDHPNIVPVFSLGTHEGRPFFAMRLIEGTTLARRLADGPLPPREAAALLAPVCRAIHYAHDRGVLHRDLKPSNILLEDSGFGVQSSAGRTEPESASATRRQPTAQNDSSLNPEPRTLNPFVTDFGLAKRIDSDATLTRSGAIVGTPSYMPPEQAAGTRGKIGPASDVYSLGAILYHMLTGRPPFQAATPVDVVLQVLEQDPLPPRLVNPQADPELELIALKCLQKPPDLRFPTAAALADDLDRYLAGEPISARSGTLAAVIGRVFRETHHAAVLENWGLLWMWHSLVLFALCGSTNLLQWRGVAARLPYVGLWTVGLGTWAAIFWALRRRSGPVTFVERQIAHVWAASMIGCSMLFLVEALLGLPVLTLSPVLALFGSGVFLVKSGILSGSFYVQSAALLLTAGLMALFPDFALSFFGVVSAACFFVPGLKYHRQRARTDRSGR